jgi:hypothetical protein
VQKGEGIEITMNCNTEAFDWIISVVKIQTNYVDDSETSYSPKEIESML